MENIFPCVKIQICFELAFQSLKKGKQMKLGLMFDSFQFDVCDQDLCNFKYDFDLSIIVFHYPPNFLLNHVGIHDLFNL